MNESKDITFVSLSPRVYENIEKKVVSLFSQLKITKIPIDPFDIAARSGYEVKPYSGLSDDRRNYIISLKNEAMSFFNPASGKYEILYDDENFPLPRVRFTLMHEIGHITLGHKEESMVAWKTANYFAGYALVPTPLISHFRCYEAKNIAKVFDVSVECAEICRERFFNHLDHHFGLETYEKDLINLFSNNNQKEAM